MRNPLNSILSQNYKLNELSNILQDSLKSDKIKTFSELKSSIQGIIKDILVCAHIQGTSTKFLNFHVNDMLSLAQIDSHKFRKIISTFDINECITEI